MYSDVVLGIEISHFEKHLERAKEKRGVKQDGMSLRRIRKQHHVSHCHTLMVSTITRTDGLKYSSPHSSECKLSVEDCELLAEDLEKLVKSHLNRTLEGF